MPNVFNAAEAIDLGIEKEKKRRDFYAFAADTFKERDMKELFARLRDWEEAHIEKFTAIRDSVEESEASESYQGEFAAYLKATIDDLLYGQVSKEWFAKNVKDQLTAVKYGMGFEKDAILFFEGILKYMTPHHKEKIEELVSEEKKHLVFLDELRQKYEPRGAE